MSVWRQAVAAPNVNARGCEVADNGPERNVVGACACNRQGTNVSRFTVVGDQTRRRDGPPLCVAQSAAGVGRCNRSSVASR